MRHQRNTGLRRLAGLISTLLVVGVVGFAGGAGSAAFAAGTQTITIGTSLSPKDVTVAPGTTVTWKAVGGKHRIRSTSGPVELDSGNIENGSWSFTFSKVGTYSYLDHENEDNAALHGTVTVRTGAPSTPGTGPGAPAAAAPTTAAVSVGDGIFSPPSITVAVGGTVTWTNNDGSQHNVTANAGAFKSTTLAPGAKFSFKFTKPGTYAYNCTFHGGMNGTIIVPTASGAVPPPAAAVPAAPVVAGAAPAAVAAAPGKPGKHTVMVSDTGYTPAVLNARAGDTVTWVNHGKAPHTATGGGFDVILDPGASASTVLQKPGTIQYVCTYHPYMRASIVVAAALPGVVVGANKSSSAAPPGGTKPASAAPASKGKTKTIEIKVNEMTFGPAMANANVGDTISWVNVGKIPHTVTAKDGSFDKTPMAPGERFNFVLRKEGSINYTCTYHPGMDGMLMVGPALAGVTVPAAAGSKTKPLSAAPPSSGQAQTHEIQVKDSSFTPATQAARVGDTISWVNLGKIPHTVTAKDHSFDKTLKPGQRFNLVLREEGTIPYVCTPHPSMFGVLIVGPALAAAVSIEAEPATLATTSPVALAGVGTGWMIIMGLLAAAQLRSRITARAIKAARRRPVPTGESS